MAHIWKNETVIVSGIQELLYQQDVVLAPPAHPFTINRTLCWFGASCSVEGGDLDQLPNMEPFGFFLEDAFSQNNPGPAHTGDSPWSMDGIDPMLTWFQNWHPSPSQSAVHVNGATHPNLSLGYDYDLPLAQQRILYLECSGFVESRGQRTWFSPNPTQMTFNLQAMGQSLDGWSMLGSWNLWAQFRFMCQYPG